MNKKILFGLIAIGTAATFWACGSGDVSTLDVFDEAVKAQITGDPSGAIVDSYVTRAIDSACQSQPDKETCMTSLDPDYQNNLITESSSSAVPGFNQTPRSSSSNATTSSATGVSSSSSAQFTQVSSSSLQSFGF